ncbi:MAG: DAK2 domain-containing protein [Clostridia bacterium]|nr:DAK2 domain-containing protein [Clostridia bacterium]
MTTYRLDGKKYVEMLSGGAAFLSQHLDELNALNVFPVADGDTGTNMYSTIDGGLSAISALDTDNLCETMRLFARASLLSARGNSGVILSQIFAGISEGLSGCDSVDVTGLSKAYLQGIKNSYASVQNPTEGTILTVFRESAEYAAEHIDQNSSVEDFFRLNVEEARRSLERTPELLPALKEADVVDSGGAGYLYIAEGMYAALTGEVVAGIKPRHDAKAIDIDRFTRDSKLEFGYCTEFLLRLTTDRVDPDSFDINTVLSDLQRLGGESVVAYKQDDVVKVHVHSFTPGIILSEMQRYGEFLTVKIENMSLGHSDNMKPRKIRKKIATVAVASGDGISALFTDMGADSIINGGQTSNPSIEDFISAFEAIEAESIIVLPNNKNILLAAEQAARVYEKSKVYVIPTKNILQGYSALAMINPTVDDITTLISGAAMAAEGVIDCEITRAVRDVTIEGMAIREGDFMAISKGRIVATAESAEDATMSMLEGCDADLCEIITVFVGAGVDAERRVSLIDRIKEKYPDLEPIFYEGGQEVYDYLIALE